MTEQRQRCQAITQDGDQCKNLAQVGSPHCHIHQGQTESMDQTMHAKPRRKSMRDDFTYMGKHVKIAMNDAGDAAKLTIEDKEFDIMLHTMGKADDNYIKLWMCPDAYMMTESPEIMAKHIIDYWYQYA